jgi:hypothetical protein
MQVSKCKWYLREGYYKRLDSFEITKLKEPHACVLTFVQKNHQQLDATFIAIAISTLVMNNLSIMDTCI